MCFFYLFTQIFFDMGSRKRVGEQLQKGGREELKECRGQNWRARLMGECHRDGENVEKG